MPTAVGPNAQLERKLLLASGVFFCFAEIKCSNLDALGHLVHEATRMRLVMPVVLHRS
jgi:hypothetical protein